MLTNNGIEVTTVSVRDNIKDDIFKGADTVVHCAAIVHSPTTEDDIYFKVNRDLTANLARLAKNSSVRHFVFLSTMSVYGINEGIITNDTPIRPTTPYGKSKLEAEDMLRSIEDKNFVVSIIQPPMVYGKNCPGNYKKLRKLALKLPFFPKVNNKRSMIYVDNLAFFVYKLLLNKKSGTFRPKNSEDVNTSNLVMLIAKAHGKKIRLCKLMGFAVKLIPIKAAKKAFGTLVYDDGMSDKCDFVGLEESVKLTEL
jgi:UDP-glucose 4-epimerase